MKTTLNKIKAFEPCVDGWKKLLTYLKKTKGDDEELPLLTILESNGLNDALWALRTVDGFDKEIRLMACDFAESVVHLTNDERSVTAIKVSRNYANGIATIEELNAAEGVAKAVAKAVAWAVAWAARVSAARVSAARAAEAAAAAAMTDAASARVSAARAAEAAEAAAAAAMTDAAAAAAAMTDAASARAAEAAEAAEAAAAAWAVAWYYETVAVNQQKQIAIFKKYVK